MPKFIPTRFHQLLADELQLIYENVRDGKDERRMFSMPPQMGKALAVGTPILTPNGWVAIENLKIGDFVFGDNGQPTQVTGVSPIWENRPVVKVTSNDGFSVLADENHEWLVRLDRSRPVWKNKTTQYLLNRTSPRNPLIPNYNAVMFPEKELPIDPYVLGLWLGDGTSANGAITMHPEDMSEISNYVLEAGFNIRKQKAKYRWGILGLCKKLRENNLINNKHIPEDYFLSSINQRLALLQGLIDTDGYIAPEPYSNAGTVEFCSTNRILAEGVRRLVVSLGVRASLIIGRAGVGGKDCGEKYRVFFLLKDAARLTRKAVRCKNGLQRPGRYLSFEEAGYSDTVCIEVAAKNHLFLAGDGLLVTHNSTMVSELFPAWVLGKEDWPIVVASYGATLAERKSETCRAIVDSDVYKFIFPKVRLSKESTSKEYWRTTKGGTYRAVGVGGALTGMAAKLLLADDLLKDRADANSEVMREAAWNWWNSVFYTRKQSKSLICLISTRWHLLDIAGHLEDQQALAEEKHGKNGAFDKWESMVFPAIAEEDEYVHGKLFRKAGEVLAPERFSLDDVMRTKNAYMSTPGGISEWAALYMQTPIVNENAEFRRGWFKYYTPDKLVGKKLYYTTFVDLAISQKKSADHTVVRTVAKEVDGPNWYLMEETAGIMDPLQTIDAMFHHYDLYRSKIYIESVAYQAALQYFVIEEQRKRGIFFQIEEIKPGRVTKKEERIRGLIPLYRAGVIWHRKGEDDALETELLQFPKGRRDDRCDALSYGLSTVRHAPRQVEETQDGRLNWKKKPVIPTFNSHQPFNKV